MVNINQVKTNKELKDFVKFPFKLYKNSKYWVPPIISEEIAVFNPNKNPILKDAKIKLFIAYKNNEIVGRIAGIINNIEVKEQKIKKMRFGWFDFIDDNNVSAALIAKVTEIGIKNDLKFLEGPVGFSNLDSVINLPARQVISKLFPAPCVCQTTPPFLSPSGLLEETILSTAF